RYRNWCVQHAFFEGQKVQEIFTSKSTSRTWKEVDQQYPPVLLTYMALSEVKSNRVLRREAEEERLKASPMAHLKVRPHHKVAAYLSDRFQSAILRQNKSHGRF